MRTLLLIIHIASGMTGLVIGPLAMRAPKRRGRHTDLGRWYQAITAALCVTAVGLVFFNPSVWPLAAIATATEAAALGGWLVHPRRRPTSLRLHVSLMCGSYVSFVTAFLVVNFPNSVVPWVLPTIVATPLIARAAQRAGTSPTRPSPSSPAGSPRSSAAARRG